MSKAQHQERRNYLRRAIAAAERERAAHREKYPGDTNGDHDHGKHIGHMAAELKGIGGGDPAVNAEAAR
jgi:hypothetical protein